MAEFNFVCTLREIRMMVAGLLNDGCRAVPEKFYPKPLYQEIRSEHELTLERARGWWTFLFIKDEWGKQRFEIDLVNNIHVGPVYVIGAKRGPPNIQLSYLDQMNSAGEDDVVEALLTIYREYWPEGGDIMLPAATRAVYAQLIATIKRKSFRQRADARTFWVTRDAKVQIDSRRVRSPLVRRGSENHGLN